MMRRGVVISLERRREQKELAKVYDCIRRLVSVPDHLIEDVLGKATGLRWPAPGLADRVVRERR